MTAPHSISSKKEAVVLWAYGDAFFVRDVDSAMLLHSPECHMGTALPLGTVPSHSQQNKHLTLPLLVPRCAARFLLAEHKAVLRTPAPQPALRSITAEPRAGDVVFAELSKRGFWLTDGIKFGAQWMCYRGDPLVFHSTCAVLVASTTLPSSSHRHQQQKQLATAADLVAFARVCNTTKKTAVVAEETDHDARFFTVAWVPDM